MSSNEGMRHTHTEDYGDIGRQIERQAKIIQFIHISA